MTTNPEGSSAAVLETESREIVARRVFDAPRELVFRMWTEAEHVKRWWGPKGFTNTIEEMDVRPGGVWRFVMHGPDGTDYKNKIVYNEVVPPERLAYSHVSGPLFDATVAFEEENGRTAVTVRMVFASAELRNRVAQEYGAVEGLHQTLGRLADELARDGAGSRRELVITRLFDAPRELVFTMWTDAQHLAAWWGPHHFTNPRCEIDPRPGGAIRIDMRGPDGTTFPMTGTFEEVTAPERIVMTTAAVDGALRMRNTITFEDESGRTKLTMRAEVLRAEAEAAFALSGMAEGWSQTLEKLQAHVDRREFLAWHVFDAPRDLLYRVWTERDHLLHWWGPKGFTVFFCTNDPRPGGVMHYGMRAPGGEEMWGRWTYRELAPPERLVFVSSFSDREGSVQPPPFPDPWPRELLTNVAFEDLGGQTKVTVRWRALDPTEAERATFDRGHGSMRQGWSGTFAELAAYLRGL